MVYLDCFGDQFTDEVHETQIFVTMSQQGPSSQRHTWFLKAVDKQRPELGNLPY